jgi:4-hydroxy-tetrahydrodipicolinate synthase
MFKGTHTALVTPFKNDYLDEDAFSALIEGQIAAGITGIVPVGTTGESPTLSHEEHLRVVEQAVHQAKGRCLVMAGTGSNSTNEAISLTCEAEQRGANAALIVAPYYNRPTQEGLFQHFHAIASKTKLPIMLYSIPGRCGVEIAIETVARLANACPNIVSIKEAGGNVDRVSQLRAALPDSFEILSGDDGLTLPFIATGAVGVVSVASNLIPAEVVKLVNLALSDDFTAARAVHERLYQLFKDLFIESNPAPIKAALALQGRLAATVRPPLVNASESTVAKLRNTLSQLGIL